MIKPDSTYGPPASVRRTLNEAPAPPEPARKPEFQTVRSPMNFLDFDNGILLYKGVTVILNPVMLREFKKLASYFAISVLQEDLLEDPEVAVAAEPPLASGGVDN